MGNWWEIMIGVVGNQCPAPASGVLLLVKAIKHWRLAYIVPYYIGRYRCPKSLNDEKVPSISDEIPRV